MKCLPLVLLVFVSFLAVVGCGNIFFRGDLGGNGIMQTASGFVSVVQVTNMPDGNGTFIDVTLITFLLNGNATTMTFCGDQRNQFPIDQFVRANFMPGQPCADIVTVVIGFH